MFQNIKHLRKVLLSSAIQNGTSIQDFVSIVPATLIKIGLRQNSLELFNSLRDRLNFCKYEMITDQRYLMIYVQTSHINQFIDIQSYDHVIDNQFNENLINSHMIWLSYHLQQQNRRITYGLQETQNQFGTKMFYISTQNKYVQILIFYQKFNLYISERTLYEMLKIIHKHQQNYLIEVDILYIFNKSLINNPTCCKMIYYSQKYKAIFLH
ncbi:unnamed protein product [Paramecium pentaurelia]|uniref:Uncharacterized protein n=1 Tax=Paramecium pentaurelia TaxID=43138 RepID=A0A8S1SAM0_9CILI|nr:unnamed protein product [Paramecium pentaurelia]